MKHIIIVLMLFMPITGCVHYYHTTDIPVYTIDKTSKAEAYLMLSNTEAENGDAGPAIKNLKSAIENDPSSPYLYLKLAQLYGLKQEFKNADKAIDQALKIDPDYIPALYGKADLYSSEGKTKQAIGILKHIVVLNPDSENAYLALALTQYHSEDIKGAQSALKDMIIHIPSSPYSYYYLAKIAVDQKKYKDAIEYYNEAYKVAPDFYTALYEEADVYAYLKEYGNAVKTYNKLIKEGSPDTPVIYEKMGDLYLSEKDYTKAIGSYLKAQSSRSSITLQLKTGIAYVEAKDYKNAEVVFKDIIRSNPDFYRAYYYYGMLLAENRKYDAAINILNKVPEGDPVYPDAVVEIAIIYSDRKDNKSAENTLLPLLKQKPSKDIYNLYASFLAADKNYKGAVSILNTALEKFTDSQSILYHLGVVYDQSGDKTAALSTMHSLLKINENNPDALNYIGYTYAEEGIKLNEAKQLIKKALKIKPDDGYITDSLGWVYYKQGFIKKAIATLVKAVKYSKGDPQILEHLGDAYIKAGDKPKAIISYEAALKNKNINDEKLKKRLQEKLHKLVR
ncbi:MAG: tetratricopeptide repeat protein [Deltaproteobacteria bacterium]|nr:tetratricopeptide repeat protein [Deltaproteobacteria bacterium]